MHAFFSPATLAHTAPKDCTVSKDNSKVSCSQSKIEFKDIICKMEVEMEGTYGLPSVFWTQNSSNEKFCTESVPDFEMATDSDESNMPPPLPYYDRKIQHDQLKSLGRAKSCSEFRAKEFLVSKRLQQSMPNIQTPVPNPRIRSLAGRFVMINKPHQSSP